MPTQEILTTLLHLLIQLLKPEQPHPKVEKYPQGLWLDPDQDIRSILNDFGLSVEELATTMGEAPNKILRTIERIENYPKPAYRKTIIQTIQNMIKEKEYGASYQTP